ncbi:metal ABC transporter solute-binding protein, Zn/Mn family [Nitrospirota bacterium]
MKRAVLLILFLLLVPGIAIAGSRVVASIYTIGHFATKVMGAEVITIMPSGVDPHEYEPTPRDIRDVYGAEVFIYQGGGLDPWAERIAPELIKRGVRVLSIMEIEGLETARGNPHVWLDPLNAVLEVREMARLLGELDPDNKAIYMNNATDYIEELHGLDARYISALETCELDTVVVSHDAYAVIALRYGFKTLPISGTSRDEEPSLRKLARIVDTMNSSGIGYVLADAMESQRFAETVARETGAELLLLHPLGGLLDGSYESVMLDNLEVLRKALKCQ